MALSLKKEEEQVRLNLQKKSVDRQFQVELFVDVSGSARRHFGSGGFYEAALQRSMAFASVVDPDGTIQITAFSDKAAEPKDFNVKQFDSILKEFLESVPSNVLWGGTSYHKAFAGSNQKRVENLVAVQEHKKSLLGSLKSLFSKPKPVEQAAPVPASQQEVFPRLIIFETDGENCGGYENFIEALRQTVADGTTFVILLGVGEFDDTELVKADAAITGVSFVPCKDIKTISDSGFYDLLLTEEFVTWLNSRPAA